MPVLQAWRMFYFSSWTFPRYSNTLKHIHEACRLQSLELLFVADEERACESERIEGNTVEKFTASRDEQHPVRSDE